MLRSIALFMIFSFTFLLAEEDSLLDRSHLDQFEILISDSEIQDKIQEAAQTINQTLKDEGVEKLMLIGLMKGAVCVAADLMRALDIHTQFEFIQTKSYGMGGTRRSELQIMGLEKLDLEDEHVLVVDDIFDTGFTLCGVIDQIKELNPKSIRSLVLLNKQVPRETSFEPDFSLFNIENRFVIGYGMDYKELWRDLPHVYAID